jgi:hypothetical protein
MTPQEVLAITPELRQIPTGWLAVSEPGSDLRIAVVAGTENDARRSFKDALEQWAKLSALPDPRPTQDGE